MVLPSLPLINSIIRNLLACWTTSTKMGKKWKVETYFGMWLPIINPIFVKPTKHKSNQHTPLLSNTLSWSSWTRYEPRHDKTNKMSVRTAKTQISLGIGPVWSESSLCAKRVAKDPSFLPADSEDWSDWADAQADLSLRWAHTHIVGFVMSRLILLFTGYMYWFVTGMKPGLEKSEFYSLVGNRAESGKTILKVGRVKRIWYLSAMRAAKVQASLRIRAVLLEPPLLTHTKQWVKRNLQTENQIPSPSEWLGMHS